MASLIVSLCHYYGFVTYKRLTGNRPQPEGDRLRAGCLGTYPTFDDDALLLIIRFCQASIFLVISKIPCYSSARLNVLSIQF
jgi:hypothetical protein